MNYSDWSRQADHFLQSRGRGVRLADLEEDFVRQQFSAGVSPFDFAQLQGFRHKNMLVAPDGSDIAQLVFTADHLKCPMCRQDSQVSRVEGLVLQQAGVTSGGIGMIHSGGGHSVGGFVAQNASLLARSLPPPKVIDSSFGMILVGLLFGMFGLLFTIGAISNRSLDLLIVGLPGIVSGIVLVVSGIRTGAAARRFRLLELPRRYQMWQRLHYCSRCAIVFDPATGVHCPISGARNTFSRIIGNQKP